MAYKFDPRLVSNIEKEEIIAKVDKYTVRNGECLDWTRSCNGHGYPQFRLGKKFDPRFGPGPYNPGHIMFSLSHNCVLNRVDFEMSHLCHNKKCVEVRHFNYEPKWVNLQRKICTDPTIHICQGHQDHPKCLL